MKAACHLFFASILPSALGSHGAQEPKKTRDEMVLDDRSSLLADDHWIYNDLEKGFAEARSTGKPLMVVYRCIP